MSLKSVGNIQSINDHTYKEAQTTLKRTICQLVKAFPDPKKQKIYSEYVETIEVNWFVTTHYDTILESILSGKAMPILPDEHFLKVADMIPIYHIHGMRIIPEGIVITQDDYSRLFRPYDYRQARLPFFVKEALVVMLGYGLGDLNVLTAIDWSKYVFKHKNKNYNFPIIQLLFLGENAPLH